MRRKTRDAMVRCHLMERMVKDIRTLFAKEGEPPEDGDVLYLWDDKQGQVENGRSYGAEGEPWSS